MRKRKVLFLGQPYIMVASVLFCISLGGLVVAFGDQTTSWQLTVEGPHEIQAGELVVLTIGQIAESNTENNADLATPDVSGESDRDATLPNVEMPNLQLRWQVLPPESASGTFRVCDGGRTLVFASRQIGCYHFVLAAADGDKLQMVTHTLLNLGENSKPIPLPPDPQPDLTPGPAPEPQREFESLSDWALQKTGTLVRSEYFEREKATLAESFVEIATRIRAGEIKTPERARVELRVLTRRKLEAVSRLSTVAWQAWETELARQLSQLEQAGKLETLEQLRAAFDAVADGLLADQTASTLPASAWPTSTVSVSTHQRSNRWMGGQRP